jgi:hypothetical protein
LAVLPGKGRDREPGDPLIRFPVFSLRANMDTIFVDRALQAYRDHTGDMRPFEALPIEVTSRILREAQRLKGFGNGSFPQPAAADGCVDS